MNDILIDSLNNELVFVKNLLKRAKEENNKNWIKQLERNKLDIEQRINLCTKKSYLVVVSKEFVLDSQIAVTPEVGDNEEGWVCVNGELVLGVFESSDKATAISNAAELHAINAECLIAYELSLQLKVS